MGGGPQDARNEKSIFGCGAVLVNWNREATFLAIMRKNAKRGAMGRDGPLKNRLRIVTFVADMIILQAGGRLLFGLSG